MTAKKQNDYRTDKTIIGPTKRKKVRTVGFWGYAYRHTEKSEERTAKKSRCSMGELYHRNYYKEVQDKTGFTMSITVWGDTQDIPADYNEITFVCLRPDGTRRKRRVH